jgi:hypothetical protein
MQSTPPPKPIDDPHEFVVLPPDVVRVAPADANEELIHLVRDLARHPSIPQIHAPSNAAAVAAVPQVDTTFRPTAVNDVPAPHSGPSVGQRVVRAFAGLMLAICLGVATSLWRSHGDAAQAMIAAWTPQLDLASFLPLEKFGLRASSTAPAVKAAAPNAAAAQGTTVAQAVPENVAPNAAPSAVTPFADSAQLQSMARDLASVGQEVEHLKDSIAELTASQQQISRDVAKASEQNARAKLSVLPPRPAVARPPKPIPRFTPAQAAMAPPLPQAAAPPTVAPYVPRQVEALPPPAAAPPVDPELSSVPRPPLPLR